MFNGKKTLKRYNTTKLLKLELKLKQNGNYKNNNYNSRNTEITLVWCISMHALLFCLIHFKQENVVNDIF